MEKEFFGLGEVQGLGLPAERTLRNRLDSRTGLIVLGGDVPSLQTLRLGGARVISRATLAAWVAAVTAAPAPSSPPDTGDASSAQMNPPKRGRGRPRKPAAGVM